MTTRQRLDLLARAWPEVFPHRELLRLVKTDLGDVAALDDWIRRGTVRVRAKAPCLIYHICAGNLAVSAWTSLAHGLLLGSRNVVKLPGDREDTTARREIVRFIRRLPAPLRKLVESHDTLDPDTLRQADAVIAFGSDAAMASLRAQTRWDQKFIAHGHAVSLLWLARPDSLTTAQARACAVDVLTYDQMGCLSPQAIYLPAGSHLEKVGALLSHALELEWQASRDKQSRPLATAARIAEARDVAQALGHRLWLPPKGHLGWTLIAEPDPAFSPSPLHGVIYLRPVKESGLKAALSGVAGRISTVGMAGGLSPSLESLFLELGVLRFCPAGRMQFPPLTWHHEGRSSLGDLVTWVDSE